MRALRRALAAAVVPLVVGCQASETRQPRTQATPANAVVVRISYGSEKKAWLTDSVEAFHKGNPRTADGRPIRVEALAEGSAESMESILAGRTDVAVWSPASSMLVDVLNERWGEAHGGLAGAARLVDDPTPLVLSPVVVALWEPMARALGWPGKPIGWA